MTKIKTKQISTKDGTIEVYNNIDLNISTGTNPTAWTDVTWNSEAFKGSIYTHSTTVSSELITIIEGGYFEFEYSVSTNNSNTSSRSGTEVEVQIDTGGGFNTIERTSAYSYNRSFTNGLDTKTKRFGLQINTGDIIKVRIRKIAGNNGTQLVVDFKGTSFLIRRIE